MPRLRPHCSKCLNRRVVTLAEYEAFQVEKEEQRKDLCLVEGMEQVVEEANKGELPNLGRALSGLQGHESEQRQNIFHSRCTNKGEGVLPHH